jgi:ureidoglycolate lyase
MKIPIVPASAEAMAPFAHLHQVPAIGERQRLETFLVNGRDKATVRLGLTTKVPSTLPLTITMLERHPFSTQTFIPLDVGRWVAVVAPSTPDGAPDEARCRAFMLGGDQAITYATNTWHMALTVLDRPGRLAVVMWRDDTAEDDEFRPLRAPLEIGA